MALLLGSNNDNDTKQKYNPKSSPDDIVVLIHNYTWIDISGTISETVSHSFADGAPMYGAIRYMAVYQYHQPLSPARERQQKSKERNEKKISCSEIVVVSGYKKSSLGSRIRRGLNKQQSRIVSDAL